MRLGFFLGAYWSARKESIEQCADRAFSFFQELTACDPLLAVWYEKGYSRKKALQKRANVENRNYLLKLLNHGRNRDMDRVVIEELGFSFGLWNGGPEGKDASISVGCGLHPEPKIKLKNTVTLNLPEDLGELKQAERMSAVLAAVARAWEPEWACVTSEQAMETRNFITKAPFVDWMVYVSREIETVPHPSSVIKLPGIGSIMIVQPTPPTGTPHEMERIHQIENIIG